MRQRENIWWVSTYRVVRQPWLSGCCYIPYLRVVQGIQGTKKEGKGGRLGGAKSHQRNNFGPPWETLRRLRGEGLVGRWTSSSNHKKEGGWVGKSACWD